MIATAVARVEEHGKCWPPSKHPKQPISTISNKQERGVLEAACGSSSRWLLECNADSANDMLQTRWESAHGDLWNVRLRTYRIVALWVTICEKGREGEGTIQSTSAALCHSAWFPTTWKIDCTSQSQRAFMNKVMPRQEWMGVKGRHRSVVAGQLFACRHRARTRQWMNSTLGRVCSTQRTPICHRAYGQSQRTGGGAGTGVVRAWGKDQPKTWTFIRL